MTSSFGRIFARVGTSCSIIGVINSLPVLSQKSDASVKSIFGVYGSPAAGHDSIRITEETNGRIGVNLKLYFANGHLCQLSQDGDWRNDHVAILADGLDANRPCRLDLFFNNRGVVLKDNGLACAPVYCGTRGKLDNTRLPKFSPNRK